MALGVLHDWFCADHGDFEGSHPICPAFGCDSHEVIKVYRKAPAFHDGATGRTDAGLRQTADSFGLSNLRSAREGEVTRPPHKSTLEVLWGADAAPTVANALQAGPAVFNVKGDDGQQRTVVDKGGMHTVAATLGEPGKVLPAAEVTRSMKDRAAA